MFEEKKEINPRARSLSVISSASSPWMCAALCSFFYVFVYLVLNPDIFSVTHFAYYNLLIDAFVHGRTDILPNGNTSDLSLFNEKWYLYWGASPVFFILPFFLIGHGAESDVLYTLVAGIFNIFIFTLVLKEFLVYIKLSFPPLLIWFTIGSFALASPNLYLSLGGRVWHTGQVISILYLLLFLLFFFRFINTKKIFLLFLASFFFGLAWLGRVSFIFYGILFLLLLKKGFGLSKKRIALVVFFCVSLGGIFFGWYNVQRFGSPFETGARFQQAHIRYQEDMAAGMFLSTKNILHNVQYYFLESPFFLRQASLNFNLEGTSVFFAYPITILFLFSLFKKRNTPSFRKFIPYAYTVLVLLMIFFLLFLGTGWQQFGSRYFFDLIPLVFLCTIPLLQKMCAPILCLFLFYGALINIFGTVIFFTTQ